MLQCVAAYCSVLQCVVGSPRVQSHGISLYNYVLKMVFLSQERLKLLLKQERLKLLLKQQRITYE